MDKTLNIVLTQTIDKKPLATVRNLPGSDVDLTPAQMRGLAKALLAAADECESRPLGKRYLLRTERSYQLNCL